MGNVIPILGGGGGAGSDDCTATKDKVLSGYTAVTKDSDDEPVAGTMANRNNVDNNGSARLLVEDGKVKMFPHQGYYGGYYDGSPYYVWDTQTLVAERGGLTAAKLLAGQSALGVIGTATNDAVLDPQYLLTGYSGYDDGVKKNGTMANQGAKTSALNCGGSYTIPKGYHNGSGKVTANSLSSQTGATATAAQILSGQTAWVNGSKLTGSMANQGTKTSALNCGSSYTIPAGYHNGSGKVTANSLSSQTSANSGTGDIRSGKTAWVNGSKITGTLSIQSAISFSAAALSDSSVRISWKNPAKGPWQGVFIQMSTSGYPGTGGGSRVYTGAGTNPNQAGGNNHVDIGGLNPSTTYYFTCTSYCDALGWGASYNVSARTNYVDLRNVFNKPGSKYVVYYVRDSYESGGESYYNRIHFRSDYGVSANMISWSIGGSIDRTWGSWSRGSRMRFYFKYSADIQPSNDLIAALNKYKNVTWVARRDKWSQTTYEVPIQSFSWIKMGGGGLNNSGYWIILDLEKDADTVLSDIRENEITFKP